MLQHIIMGYNRLYGGLQEVTVGYNRLQQVTIGYSLLQTVAVV